MSLSIDGVWKAGVWATTAWADGVWYEGEYIPPVVEETPAGGGIGHGGSKKRKNKKPVLIKVDEYESPAEVIRQIEEKYSNSVKKSANKPKVKLETPLAAPSRSPEQWVTYYKAMADNLATQRDYRQMLDLIARASLRIKQEAERQEVERQEEELITLLLVSL